MDEGTRNDLLVKLEELGQRKAASAQQLREQFAWRPSQRRIRLPPSDFMNQHIHMLRKLDQVFGGFGVSRHHDGMSAIVDAIAKCRCDRRMIDEERSHSNAVRLVDDALANLGSDDPNAFGRKPFQPPRRT